MRLCQKFTQKRLFLPSVPSFSEVDYNNFVCGKIIYQSGNIRCHKDRFGKQNKTQQGFQLAKAGQTAGVPTPAYKSMKKFDLKDTLITSYAIPQATLRFQIVR